MGLNRSRNWFNLIILHTSVLEQSDSWGLYCSGSCRQIVTLEFGGFSIDNFLIEFVCFFWFRRRSNCGGESVESLMSLLMDYRSEVSILVLYSIVCMLFVVAFLCLVASIVDISMCNLNLE